MVFESCCQAQSNIHVENPINVDVSVSIYDHVSRLGICHFARPRLVLETPFSQSLRITMHFNSFKSRPKDNQTPSMFSQRLPTVHSGATPTNSSFVRHTPDSQPYSLYTLAPSKDGRFKAQMYQCSAWQPPLTAQPPWTASSVDR